MSDDLHNMATENNRKKIIIQRIFFLIVISAILFIAIYKIIPCFSKVKKTVILEAGSEIPEVQFFLKNKNDNGKILTDMSTVDTRKIGKYTVLIKVNGRKYKSKMIVEDTIAPFVTTKKVYSWNGEPVDAVSFIDTVFDITSVKAEYVKEPDYGVYGKEQPVVIKITDEGNNSVVAGCTFEAVKDDEPPVILGACDRTVYKGMAISYTTNISVTDNLDENPSFVVDSQKVDIETPGDYPVTYTATDGAGNRTTKTVIFTVRDKDENAVDIEKVNELADRVLAQITSKDMTKLDVVRAIYNWVRANIRYFGSSDKGDWIKEAYAGFTEKKGDCFTFYSVTQALLIRADIQNMRITRDTKEIDAVHFWNLVNIGTGWYHLDTCFNIDGYPFECFMKTDKQLKEYEEKNKDNPQVYYYYVFDNDKYPDRSEEIIN